MYHLPVLLQVPLQVFLPTIKVSGSNIVRDHLLQAPLAICSDVSIKAVYFLKAGTPYRTKHGKTPSFSFVFATVVVVQICDWTETSGKALPFTPESPARSDRDSSVDYLGLINARSSYEKVVFTRLSSQRGISSSGKQPDLISFLFIWVIF
ncbi:hypothetical protein SAMN02910371_03756 [Butyrivibrio sp. INlla14]|nr:hypothetical protein SAMN02910371_03756 [Butyrivibrio sp. INlla14]